MPFPVEKKSHIQPFLLCPDTFPATLITVLAHTVISAGRSDVKGAAAAEAVSGGERQDTKGRKAMEEEKGTQERILEAAREEFLEKGFERASLRRIVKEAGVTTGAFYRYYPTKEALFDALAGPHARAVMGFFDQGLAAIREMPASEQTGAMSRVTGDCIGKILDYVYDHYTECKLLICSAGGTSYEQFIHEMTEKEVEATYRYIEAVESTGHPMPEIDRELCHMISSGLFTGMFEMVAHDMEKEAASRRIRQLREFHTGGWMRIMGVDFDGGEAREAGEDADTQSGGESR